MFALLGQIVKLQTSDLKPVSLVIMPFTNSFIINVSLYLIIQLPTRLDKDKLKEFAQLDHRYKVFLQFFVFL